MSMGTRVLRSASDETGEADIGSIMIAAVIVGILTLGIAALVFGAVPWAQDNAAKQALSSVRTAENTAARGDNAFIDQQALVHGEYITETEGLVVVTGKRPPAGWDGAVSAGTFFGDPGSCYVASSSSSSGKKFFITDSRSEPTELVGSLGMKDMRCNVGDASLAALHAVSSE